MNILGTILNGLNSWKTTLTGVVGAIAVLVFNFSGVEVPKEVQVGTVALLLFLFGLFSKDATVTHTLETEPDTTL